MGIQVFMCPRRICVYARIDVWLYVYMRDGVKYFVSLEG